MVSRASVFWWGGLVAALALLVWGMVGMGSRFEVMKSVARADRLSAAQNDCLRAVVAERFEEKRPADVRAATSRDDAKHYDLGLPEASWAVATGEQVEIAFMVPVGDAVRRQQASRDRATVVRALSTACRLDSTVFVADDDPEY